MRLLDRLVFHSRAGELKEIEIYQGDLTAMPVGDPVDVVVVSAFPADYSETSGSLVGALARRGISVANLALDVSPSRDLRSIWSSWLSRPLPHSGDLGFRHLLVFEPASEPDATVDHLFRALMGFIGSDPPIMSVATPLVGCGDRGAAVEVVLPRLVDAAMHWMNLSAMCTLRVVERDPARATQMAAVFRDLRRDRDGYPPPVSDERAYDVFVSYSWGNADAADAVVTTLRRIRPELRIFRDVERLRNGNDLFGQLDRAVRASHRVVPLYSSAYVRSEACMREFDTAYNIQTRGGRDGLLFPLYVEPAELPARMTKLVYRDCTSAGTHTILRACEELVSTLIPSPLSSRAGT